MSQLFHDCMYKTSLSLWLLCLSTRLISSSSKSPSQGSIPLSLITCSLNISTNTALALLALLCLCPVVNQLFVQVTVLNFISVVSSLASLIISVLSVPSFADELALEILIVGILSLVSFSTVIILLIVLKSLLVGPILSLRAIIARTSTPASPVICLASHSNLNNIKQKRDIQIYIPYLID